MSIWVNISTSASWRQPPFGIVRVERNVARGLRETLGRDRVRYCVWDHRMGAFVEAKDAGRDEWPERSGAAHASPALGTRPAAGRREAIRSIGRGLRDLAPARLRTLVERVSRAGGSLARRASESRDSWGSRLRAGRGYKGSALGKGAVGCLRRGDVLVTLGLEWETGFMPNLPALKTRLGIRIVGCCHDLIPIKYPQYCVRYVADRFPEYLSHLARSCDAIACVSACSLTDLREALSQMGEPVPHLFTIRLGADLPPADTAPVSPVVSSVTGQPYVLFVSTMERRKNHEVLYRAFHRLARVHGRERLPKLVFVGSRGWGVGDLLNDIELDPMTRGLIVQLHNVSDSELRILYRNALFCVFPSLYEGWGLPVAEALGFGKSVICSDRGAVPEVGGDLVEYVDPWDLPGWVHAIEGLWLDEARRQRMAERVVREYQMADWSATAGEIGRVALELEKGFVGTGPSPGGDISV